jgi:hypothetical protein
MTQELYRRGHNQCRLRFRLAWRESEIDHKESQVEVCVPEQPGFNLRSRVYALRFDGVGQFFDGSEEREGRLIA